MNRLLTSALLIFALWPLSGATVAAGLPDYYPETFDHVGMVNAVLNNERILIVDDVRVPMAANLRVYNEHTRFENRDYLRPGMKVGFGTSGTRSSEAIKEIWVLPLDYQPRQTPR